MRRWLGATLVGGLITALLAGCGNPAGVDGSLTDDWTAPPDPAPFVPAVGTCHADLRPEAGVPLSLYTPIDCAGAHGLETVHVGQFTGADAERVDVPPEGGPALRAAFAECDAKVKEFAGADWRTGRLTLVVRVPSPAAWVGGSRWFRCDVGEVGESTGGASCSGPAACGTP